MRREIAPLVFVLVAGGLAVACGGATELAPTTASPSFG
jgi:hypothetical protein